MGIAFKYELPMASQFDLYAIDVYFAEFILDTASHHTEKKEPHLFYLFALLSLAHRNDGRWLNLNSLADKTFSFRFKNTPIVFGLPVSHNAALSISFPSLLQLRQDLESFEAVAKGEQFTPIHWDEADNLRLRIDFERWQRFKAIFIERENFPHHFLNDYGLNESALACIRWIEPFKDRAFHITSSSQAALYRFQHFVKTNSLSFLSEEKYLQKTIQAICPFSRLCKFSETINLTGKPISIAGSASLIVILDAHLLGLGEWDLLGQTLNPETTLVAMGTPLFKNQLGSQSIFSWVAAPEVYPTDQKTAVPTEILEPIGKEKLFTNIIDRFARLSADADTQKSFASFRLFSLIEKGPFAPKALNRFLALQSNLTGGSTVYPIRLTKSLPALNLFAGERGVLKKEFQSEPFLFSKMGLFKKELFIPEQLLPPYEIDFVEPLIDFVEPLNEAVSFLQSPFSASEIWILVSQNILPEEKKCIETLAGLGCKIFEVTA